MKGPRVKKKICNYLVPESCNLESEARHFNTKQLFVYIYALANSKLQEQVCRTKVHKSTPLYVNPNRETHATITYKSNIYKSTHNYITIKRKQATSGYVGLALDSWFVKNSLSMANLCNKTSTFQEVNLKQPI